MSTYEDDAESGVITVAELVARLEKFDPETRITLSGFRDSSAQLCTVIGEFEYGVEIMSTPGDGYP